MNSTEFDLFLDLLSLQQLKYYLQARSKSRVMAKRAQKPANQESRKGEGDRRWVKGKTLVCTDRESNQRLPLTGREHYHWATYFITYLSDSWTSNRSIFSPEREAQERRTDVKSATVPPGSTVSHHSLTDTCLFSRPTHRFVFFAGSLLLLALISSVFVMLFSLQNSHRLSSCFCYSDR